MADEAYTNYPRPRRLKHYADMYGEFHTDNPKRLSGKLPRTQSQIIVSAVAELVAHYGQRERKLRLLDYGAGKGYQYLASRAHEAWGGILPYCYDPGVSQLSARPVGAFEGIICTDVMEHIEEEDIRDTLRDIFSFTVAEGPSFVYLHICCRTAWKAFKDGRNLHATVKPPEWWDAVIAECDIGRDQCKIVVTYELERETDKEHFTAAAIEEAEANEMTNKRLKKIARGVMEDPRE